jgi:translation elongation factor P/translation initiation factor 5A
MTWYGIVSPYYLIASGYSNSYTLVNDKLIVSNNSHYSEGLKFIQISINNVPYLQYNDQYLSISNNGVYLMNNKDFESNINSLVILEDIKENFFKLKNSKEEYLTVNLEVCSVENGGVFQFMDLNQYPINVLELKNYNDLIASRPRNIINAFTSIEGIDLLDKNCKFFIICNGEVDVYLASFDRDLTNEYPLLFSSEPSKNAELKIELVSDSLSIYWSEFGRLVIDYYDEHDTDTAIWSKGSNKEILVLEPSKIANGGYYLKSSDYYIQVEMINDFSRCYLIDEANEASIFQFKFIY